MTEEIDIKIVIRALRDLSRKMMNNESISPMEIQKAKTIAAKSYLGHTSRKFTLNSEDFQLVVDILRIREI